MLFKSMNQRTTFHIPYLQLLIRREPRLAVVAFGRALRCRARLLWCSYIRVEVNWTIFQCRTKMSSGMRCNSVPESPRRKVPLPSAFRAPSRPYLRLNALMNSLLTYHFTLSKASSTYSKGLRRSRGQRKRAEQCPPFIHNRLFYLIIGRRGILRNRLGLQP